MLDNPLKRQILHMDKRILPLCRSLNFPSTGDGSMSEQIFRLKTLNIPLLLVMSGNMYAVERALDYYLNTEKAEGRAGEDEGASETTVVGSDREVVKEAKSKS
jgi:hypothetical protein